MRLKHRKGMTLIELMIVVAIIGVLAAVAIPRYADMLEKANLGATLGNLASLRSAVSIYYGTFMAYPGTMDPAIQPGMDKALDVMPYVKAKHPSNTSPYGNKVTVGITVNAMPTGLDSGWFYNDISGYIYINSTATDTKGVPYTTY